MQNFNVDQWMTVCVGQLAHITPPELRTTDELWEIAATLYEASGDRDPIEVAEEWQRLSGLPLRVWRYQA